MLQILSRESSLKLPYTLIVYGCIALVVLWMLVSVTFSIRLILGTSAASPENQTLGAPQQLAIQTALDTIVNETVQIE